MLAGPHERTLDDAVGNIDEMIKLDADFAVFAVYSPYPGTESFADGRQARPVRGRLLGPHDEGPAVRGRGARLLGGAPLPRRDPRAAQDLAPPFYMRPKFVARQVLGLETGSELKRLAQGALSLVKLELLNSKSRTAPV